MKNKFIIIMLVALVLLSGCGKKIENVDSKNESIELKSDSKEVLVSLNSDNDNLKLVSSEVADDYSKIKDNINKYVAYDISILNNEEKVEVNEADVYLKIPTGYDENNLKVYYVLNNEVKEEYDVEVIEKDNEKYAKFKATHFSIYMLVEINNTIDVVKEEEKTPPTTDNSNNNTKTDTKKNTTNNTKTETKKDTTNKSTTANDNKANTTTSDTKKDESKTTTEVKEICKTTLNGKCIELGKEYSYDLVLKSEKHIVETKIFAYLSRKGTYTWDDYPEKFRIEDAFFEGAKGDADVYKEGEYTKFEAWTELVNGTYYRTGEATDADLDFTSGKVIAKINVKVKDEGEYKLSFDYDGFYEIEHVNDGRSDKSIGTITMK